jgi:hypothetical protein
VLLLDQLDEVLHDPLVKVFTWKHQYQQQ